MSTENQSVCAVVVAAGSSRRMGGENKLLLPLCGKPVLAHTLTVFQMCGAVRDIVLVCREQDMEVYRTLAAAIPVPNRSSQASLPRLRPVRSWQCMTARGRSCPMRSSRRL